MHHGERKSRKGQQKWDLDWKSEDKKAFVNRLVLCSKAYKGIFSVFSQKHGP